MPSPIETRADLAVRQAVLASALLAGGKAPEGFDCERLQAAALALQRKRRRAVMRVWPGLAHSLGKESHALFTEYVVETPLPQHGGALADGRRFAAWLAARRLLPHECRLQVLRVDLRYAMTADGLTPRRWPAIRVALSSGRLVVGLWIPGLGEHWFGLPR